MTFMPPDPGSLSLLLILSAWVFTPSASAAVQPPDWRTGRDLVAALREPMGWSSQGAELTDQLEQWQAQSAVMVIVDRRVDPHQVADVAPGPSTRIDILDRICAAGSDISWCLTERFVYIGPKVAAGRLPALLYHQSAVVSGLRGELPAAASRRMTVRSTWSRERLTEPRSILISEMQRAGLQLENSADIPHDLWDAGVWPGMTLTEMAAVMLNQFDMMLTPSETPTVWRIVPIDMQLVTENQMLADREQQQPLSKLAAELNPEFRGRWQTGRLRFSGTLRQHGELQFRWQQLMCDASRSAVVTSESLRTRRFTLTVARATVGQLIDNLIQNQIPVELPDRAHPRLKEVLATDIRLDVQSVAGSDLFPQIFSPYFDQVIVEHDRVILQFSDQ